MGFPSPLFETPHHNSYRQELYRSEKRNYREDGGQTRSSKRRRFSSSSPPPRRRFQELNDLRVGYSDSSLLFNRRDHVILDTPEEQVILPVTEDKRFNKALVVSSIHRNASNPRYGRKLFESEFLSGELFLNI